MICVLVRVSVLNLVIMFGKLCYFGVICGKYLVIGFIKGLMYIGLSGNDIWI